MTLYKMAISIFEMVLFWFAKFDIYVFNKCLSKSKLLILMEYMLSNYMSSKSVQTFNVLSFFFKCSGQKVENWWRHLLTANVCISICRTVIYMAFWNPETNLDRIDLFWLRLILKLDLIWPKRWTFLQSNVNINATIPF